MLPSSVIVIVATALLTLGAALLWARRAGVLRNFDAQSRVIFDGLDVRLERPMRRVKRAGTRNDTFIA